jgi:hypothetical protein
MCWRGLERGKSILGGEEWEFAVRFCECGFREEEVVVAGTGTGVRIGIGFPCECYIVALDMKGHGDWRAAFILWLTLLPFLLGSFISLSFGNCFIFYNFIE